MLAALLVSTAALGLNIPRRGLIVAGATSAITVSDPARAAVFPDGGVKGPELILQAYNTALPDGRLLEWYEEHLTPDFIADYDYGTLTLDRDGFLAATKSTLRSFPDYCVRISSIGMADSPKKVGWVAVSTGTLTGEPFILSGLPQVNAGSQSLAFPADKGFAEVVTADFLPGLQQIRKLSIKLLKVSDGKWSGPYGIYVQVGGDATKLPALNPKPDTGGLLPFL